MSNTKPQIIIIGAGASGISAGVKLMENGFDNLIILEASNRIGGRIESIKFGEGFIDLGAQWISGEENNAVYEMCHSHFNFGSTGFKSEMPVALISNGEIVDKEKYLKLHELREMLMNEIDDIKNYSDKSLGEYFEAKYFEALKDSKYDDIDEKLRKMFISYWHRETNTWFPSFNWFDVSAKLYPLGESCEGDQYMTWKEHGYQTLFDYITKKQPDESKEIKIDDKIQLNKKVIKINWMGDKIILETSDKSFYSADHVLLTMPLGVLQAYHLQMFNPKLPCDKIKAIENIQFGTLGKIFLEFEEPFWGHERSDFFVMYSLLWTDKDLKEIIGTDKEWLYHIIGFLHVDAQPRLLEALLAGDKIKEFEGYSNDKIESDCMWLLEKFLKRKLKKPLAMRRTNWGSRKNFLGTYSYLSMDSARNDITCENLAESIKDESMKPILLFSGEATDTKYQGYVHGAINSGRRAAQEIIDYHFNFASKL